MNRAALAAVGAALAIAVVATPVAVLAGGEDRRSGSAPAASSPPATDSPTEAVTVSATPTPAPAEVSSPLPVAAQLPRRQRLTPWAQVPVLDRPVVACQPGVAFGGELVGQRDFAARFVPQPGVPDGGEETAAEVRLVVLAYPSEVEAEAAVGAVSGWITDCDDPAQMDPAAMTRLGDVVEVPSGRYAPWVYTALEICDDCDAAWFDRMGVVRTGERVVVLTYRELGGPLEPEGLDAAMRELMTVVAESAAG